MFRKILILILLAVNTAFALKIKHADHTDFYRNKKILKKRYVKSLDIIYSGETTKFVFEISSKIKGYKIYTLNDPYRIVIDFLKKNPERKLHNNEL